jgi:EAL domain-containing protein (putative c-di-GMP-specific phosphodiesterase class I)
MGGEAKEESMIARTIIPLAQHLGLDVIAEGVETLEQADLLKELQCKYAQGFFFSKPINAEDVQRLLAKTLSIATAVDAPPAAGQPALV